MKLPFDKVYCLHLAEDKDRYENIQKEFKRLGIEKQVEIWWTCKREISNKIALNIDGICCKWYKDLVEKDSKYNPNTIYGAVFNVALEHYTIIKQAYLRGFEHIMIMEDDIKFDLSIEEYEKYFNNLPEDYDILWLCYCFQEDVGDSGLKKWGRENEFGKLFYKWDWVTSAQAYCLSRKAMEYYIKFMDEKFSPADLPLMHYRNNMKYSDTELVNYVTNKSIIKSSNHETTIR